ncbi:hypothetical protein J2857_003588 [Neorhizobium galegae]|uniref:hypothetical protein n=1 Tax=Neorhizobium galegae TaxID=399 RepID=UPI001AE391B8|nr:hypothetical protein [Neorhizobium galegae]MBP2560819.1 hypothetical protein [Neorhizobium galegae]
MQQQTAHSPAVARNVRAEMTSFMLENPNCTKEDLKITGGFNEREITIHAGPASEAADKRSKRRIA